MERLVEFIGNNLFWVSLWGALLLLLVWNLFGHALLGVSQIDPAETTRLINHDHAAVLDIRSLEDYARGHILNAIHVPEASLGDPPKELKKVRDKPLVVCDQSGAAAARAARRLKQDGFARVACLKGGVVAWQRAGLPLTRQ